jgi:hypothetical protein
MSRAKLNQNKKRTIEVKVNCVMWNKQIDGLAINHSLAPLFEQE